MTSAAPDWSESSVRWLQSRHPVYLGARTPKFDLQLEYALNRMKFRYVELALRDGLKAAGYKAMMKGMAQTWSKEDHEKMVAFLEAGGHDTELRAYKAEDTTEALEIEGAEPGTAPEPLLVVPNGLEPVIEKLKPKAQLSPERELEEILDAAGREADERFGSW